LPDAWFGRAEPCPRLGERPYFSVFLVRQHTFVAEISPIDQRPFPIATIVVGPPQPGPNPPYRHHAASHGDNQQDRDGQGGRHGIDGVGTSM
jgi:hypothetical protein